MISRRIINTTKKLRNSLGIICAPTTVRIQLICRQSTMELQKVCCVLRKMADTSLAGSWDNVGLLIEPSLPHTVDSILLTNDLSEVVLAEALEKKVQLIISYHPPIFSALKRLTQAHWKQRIVVRCIENRIAVYSPHTSWDAVPGGVNDWLIQPFDGTKKNIESVVSTSYPSGGAYRVELVLPPGGETVKSAISLQAITETCNTKLIFKETMSDGALRVGLSCSETALNSVVSLVNTDPNVQPTLEIFKAEKPPVPNTGAGRVCVLNEAISIHEVIGRVKRHLQLEHLRVALAKRTNTETLVKSIAVCAGSGASVLSGVKADVYLTGEMSHHEVLEATHRHATVILCDHSNTERGYLLVVAVKLREELGNVTVHISSTDRDPLEVM